MFLVFWGSGGCSPGDLTSLIFTTNPGAFAKMLRNTGVNFLPFLLKSPNIRN